MSKSLILSVKSWNTIYQLIAKEYPPSVLLIREKMKSVLGFTPRTHEEWIDQEVDLRDIRYETKFRITNIHLDFYNEPKRTMFLLKYSEYIKNDFN
jgi:hypothetical protein